MAAVLLSLLAVYGFAAVHATLKAKTAGSQTKVAGLLKAGFTLAFLLLTALSFANRRITMGFDIMRMDVPVMQPALLQGDRFVVDTWTTEGKLKRGSIVVHSFHGQKGLYLNRVVAVGGDKIEKDRVFINGRFQNEPYVLTISATKSRSQNLQATVVPTGHYFVMGTIVTQVLATAGSAEQLQWAMLLA